MIKLQLHQKLSYYASKDREGFELTLDEADILIQVLQNHPDYNEIIGCGIDRIVIEGGIFFLIRRDSNKVKLDLRKCVYGGGMMDDKSDMEKMYEACRIAIMDYREEFEINQIRSKVYCPYTGELLTKKTSYVDHMLPLTFKKIIEQFIDHEDLSLSDIKFIKFIEYGGWYNLPSQLKESFIKYHRECAILHLLKIPGKSEDILEDSSKENIPFRTSFNLTVFKQGSFKDTKSKSFKYYKSDRPTLFYIEESDDPVKNKFLKSFAGVMGSFTTHILRKYYPIKKLLEGDLLSSIFEEYVNNPSLISNKNGEKTVHEKMLDGYANEEVKMSLMNIYHRIREGYYDEHKFQLKQKDNVA